MKKTETSGSMFTTLEQGDRLIKKAKKKAVVLVGKTRGGKSCTFNWIKGNPMIGVSDGSTTYYERLTKG